MYNKAINEGVKNGFFKQIRTGKTNPSEFDTFWELQKRYDIILGYRKIRGDGKFYKFVEIVVCALLWVFFGIRAHDSNAPFRLMGVRILAKYMRFFTPEFNLPNIILVTFFAKNNEKIIFKEISFKSRNIRY